MALDDQQFFAWADELIASVGHRRYEPALFERALGYPWERPAGSFLLRDGEVVLLSGYRPAERRAVVDGVAQGRHPIVSFGANASPSALTMKFAHFSAAEDREVLVLTGYLQGLDVGAMATPGILGYTPAALFASPGTAVRAAVVWTTPAQATQLAWSEVTYRLGRLDEARFEMDEADLEVSDLFAFVSRRGCLRIDGSPVALAAIPAAGRTAAALTQEELLDVMAGLVLGPEARAETLVRAIFDDLAGVMARAAETVWPDAHPFEAPWTPYPGDGD